ncbi:MAG: undecaprenyldiphospho-muramoylpentapeptide beta-N-acetylglucosaminyltransferase [Zoogloeaceae bacterium]|jgi:UDP-N-acetylglucosamine--N-acetylmuramyl-(pentapeptide) pyrophosphoryl-undecaprenol N-acetylglucosamine transferase|nr:undecaprenyldiphospho-muramoylpentapeptide beta-N-acetylglucosaminyltransferase [Zoogloeaceae bacterium]
MNAETPDAPTILIMAGGTGGHIFPALAVAQILRDEGWRVLWLGNADAMEAQIVPKHGFPLVPVRFPPLRGKGLWRKLMLPVNLARACWRARQELRRLRPDVVLGMGGYVTFPGGLMARLLGIPFVIHEQNSIAGLANRVLAFFAQRVLTGFPDALEKGEWVGNPVREDVARLPEPEERLRDRSGPLQLLVVGGSLGAQALNETIPRGLLRIEPEQRPEVVHQSGAKHLEALQANYADYREAGGSAHCVDFIEDMAGAYAWADLVICRAGALTIAELAAAGVASILVPFPQAVDDHQTGNARFLAQTGGAILLPQGDLTPESVALLGNYRRSQLLEMAKKARLLARPGAARAVADVCREMARKPRNPAADLPSDRAALFHISL